MKNASPWFPRPTPPRPEARWRLVCLAFAGGAAAYFRPWEEKLPDTAEFWPAELPGHGVRFGEPLVDDMEELARDLAAALTPHDDLPLVLFGHSMGSAIIFAATRALEARGLQPAALVCSGRIAPHRVKAQGIHRRSDEGIVAEMIRLGGTPQEVLENRELLNLVLPVVRNDYRLIETYDPAPHPRIRAPIRVFCGEADEDANREGLLAWGELTQADCRLDYFPGDHFYLTDQRDDVVGALAAFVERELGRTRDPKAAGA
ncbi:MAG: alpha/beta fold hydrolase [Kiloniellales bacterium]|nr:alpha/beta fold hydrolase [Kiloniellales bacterium]